MIVPEALPLDDQLCFAIYSANIAINRVYRPVLDRLGITYPQYLVLSMLWQADGQAVGRSPVASHSNRARSRHS
jgi:hypothetical protein